MSTAAPSAPTEAQLAAGTSPAEPGTSKKKFIALGVVAAVALGTFGWVLAHRGLESTDDAQTDSDVVAVPAKVGGTIRVIHFTENQQVKAGDVLAEIDDAAVKARLAQADAAVAAALASAEAADADAELAETNAVGNKSVAEAGLRTAAVGAASFADQIKEAEAQARSAEASFAQATTDHEREKALFDKNSISKAEFDKAETAYAVASANLEGARARVQTLKLAANQAASRVVEASARAKQSSPVETLVREARAKAAAAHAQVDTAKALRDLAALDLSYTKIVAPHDGVVSKKTINEGQTVSPGQPIVQLVTPEVWVTGNFKETQVGKMHPGEPAHFSVDAYPGVEITGEVQSISGATGARFSLLPPDNATGNFTKVVQRVPVRIKVHDVPAGVSLRPGMSVDLTVDTR
ncbi:MAG TPA: HlyD family secretion protein [Polyangiaceae bacterium]|nr:HlyD family secretion protein [Polyangiaceae bacterium]